MVGADRLDADELDSVARPPGSGELLRLGKAVREVLGEPPRRLGTARAVAVGEPAIGRERELARRAGHEQPSGADPAQLA